MASLRESAVGLVDQLVCSTKYHAESCAVCFWQSKLSQPHRVVSRGLSVSERPLATEEVTFLTHPATGPSSPSVRCTDARTNTKWKQLAAGGRGRGARGMEGKGRDRERKNSCRRCHWPRFDPISCVPPIRCALKWDNSGHIWVISTLSCVSQ